MERWQNFYVQKEGLNEAVKESVAAWGIFCKDIPFKVIEKVKEPAKRTWNDEHGDDEYIGDNGLYLEAYEMEVEFGCTKMDSTTLGTVDNVRDNINTFIQYLRTSGMMKMYSSYTRIGRKNVRLVSVNDNAKWVSKGEWRTVNNTRTFVVTEEWCIFKVKFKVNDPITDIIYSNGGLIEDE